MPANIVVGSQWGDEGKGKIIDIMASRADVVVRATGGNNAGHTVVNNGELYKLHLIPSGILYPETLCLIGAGVVLDPKDFISELDSLESLFIVNQTILEEMGEPKTLVDDLQDVLASIREIMRCDVLDEPFRRDYMIGLSHKELREHSHNPMKYYKVKQMLLPDHTLGKAYALLNQLRSAVRETEVAAAAAFHEGKSYTREDIIEELNRMSSAMHILMCKYLAGEYKTD